MKGDAEGRGILRLKGKVFKRILRQAQYDKVLKDISEKF